MIDVASETLVPLRQVPKLLPPRPNGKRIHISAVYRWIQRGIKGTRLEAVRIGGTTYTSLEAIQRFTVPSGHTSGVPTQLTTTRTRRKQIDHANREVARLLNLNPDPTVP